MAIIAMPTGENIAPMPTRPIVNSARPNPSTAFFAPLSIVTMLNDLIIIMTLVPACTAVLPILLKPAAPDVLRNVSALRQLPILMPFRKTPITLDAVLLSCINALRTPKTLYLNNKFVSLPPFNTLPIREYIITIEPPAFNTLLIAKLKAVKPTTDNAIFATTLRVAGLNPPKKSAMLLIASAAVFTLGARVDPNDMASDSTALFIALIEPFNVFCIFTYAS